MNFIKNLRIGPRLIVAFAIVCAITATVGGIGIVNMSKINDKADDMYAQELQGLSYIKEANINLIYIGRARGNLLLSTSTDERERHKASIAKSSASVKDYVEKAKPLFVSQRANEIFADFQRVWTEYESKTQRALALAASEQLQTRSEALTQALSAVRSDADKLDDMLTELTKQKEARAKQASDETTVMYQNSRALMLALIAGAVGLGMLLGFVISRSITRPLNEAVQVAETVAAGDLTSKIEVISTDETGQLLTALKKMNESLVGIVGNVRASSDSIATGSAQIATGNADLSQRTEEQASNLQQTAASMEQLTATVKQNADTARQANQLATSASAAATQGGVVVGQVVSTMQDITASSKKISDIIGVIDGIAFQTNILALNAAVEAARAGEQGRGFAVVASEVRTLAQRSAGAAKEIKTLIGASVEKVEAGSRLADDAGQSMNDIVNQVKRVTDLIAEISSASGEQTQGISQVSDAVSQLDQVTQQNAALVEESAAAADSLQQQAARLAEVVGVFRLIAGPSTPSVVTPAPRGAAERHSPGRVVQATRAHAAGKAAAAPRPAAKTDTAAGRTAATASADNWTSF